MSRCRGVCIDHFVDPCSSPLIILKPRDYKKTNQKLESARNEPGIPVFKLQETSQGLEASRLQKRTRESRLQEYKKRAWCSRLQVGKKRARDSRLQGCKKRTRDSRFQGYNKRAKVSSLAVKKGVEIGVVLKIF